MMIVVSDSVVNPDPVGSGTFSRIRFFVSDPNPVKKEKIINNQNVTSFCFNCTENTVE